MTTNRCCCDVMTTGAPFNSVNRQCVPTSGVETAEDDTAVVVPGKECTSCSE